MDGKKGKRSRMNDAGNSGNAPDDAADLNLVEQEHDDQQDNEGLDTASGNGNSSNVDRINKHFAGCVPASVGDVVELVNELRDNQGGRVVVDRMEGLIPQLVANCTAEEFDLLQLANEWRPGRYRIWGRVDGERGRRWQRIITIANKPGTQARAVDGIQGSSDPRFAPPPPTYPGWPAPHYPAHYPPPPVQVVSAPAQDMGIFKTLLEVQMKQTEQANTLLMQLLTQKVEQQSKPAMVSEMRELLNFTKDLRALGSANRGGDDDDEDGFSSALGKIGAAFMRELEQRQQQQQPAVVPAPAAAAPGHEAGTSHQVHHPRPAHSPVVARAQQHRATPAHAPNSIEAKIKRAAKLVLWTAEDPERDPGACADMMTSILGVELVERAINSMEPGQLAGWLTEQIPELAPSADFLAEVERELRAQMSSDVISADAPAADPHAAGAST